MSKGRGRNRMLGVGGQRKKLPRRELRGGRAQASGGGDQAAEKKELLRRMRERNERRASE
ncbi:DUF6243 family protein [Actinomadura madurae]|uniref:DUF6243 family protein n=1 Tax=Actinomadura madurae TaxID=1993 RepID=UPI0020D2212B|nr:DUF6243 family protein [Actinomadura madurae]